MSFKKARKYFLPTGLLLALAWLWLSAPATQSGLANWPGQDEGWGCTSIMVGRLASADGSVITCHTCDGNYRQWVNIVPRRQNKPGTMNKVYEGRMNTETPQDMKGVILKGEVPEVPETFAFLNTAYPALNEFGLAIGETTIGGKQELYNPEGMFMIEELERLMLERCKTAREAIKLAGELVKQYGYGDYGECLTIADSREVWHFEIFGAGPLEKGAVWAAVRIPDDQVGISANIPRIGQLNLKDPNNYMASDNVFKVAEEMGWWDPKKGEPFKFWKAYGGPKAFAIREYFVFSQLAPSLKLDLNAEELPFSIKPEKKVSVRDILRLYRETYEGTDYDMSRNLMVKKRNSEELTRSPVVSNWMSRDWINLINTLKPGTISPQRTIAINACAYATVIQLRSWLPPAVGAVCWFAFDNPALSARIPIFAGVTELPPSFEVCAQHRYREDSAAWIFRRANRLAILRWGDHRQVMEDTVRAFEEKAMAELPLVEKKVLEIMNSKTPDKEPLTVNQYLTQYTGDFARAAMQKYRELYEQFWTRYARGF
ncbi:MAG: Peptidase U34, dipeptidase precursor [Candidatus Saccharicenans subterraneus]|uniref:Dipeptidase n=1 Tax=Candidatus Saccharicenans subterraneus TaxID=2508984 RepID=A0A3E2BMI9_9BACT|nr:MAG: Peptidase U34, dipeptidase precursor [Candidatus Saccharicenans subterraneum]